MQSFLDNVLRFEEINKKYSKLCELLTYEEVLLDKKLFLNYQKQKQSLEEIALKYQDYLNLKKDVKSLEDEIKNVDISEKELFVLELENNKKEILTKQKELINILNKFNAEIQEIIIEVNANKTEISKQILNTIQKGFNLFCIENNFEFNCDGNENKKQIKIKGFNVKELFKNEVGLHKSLTEPNENYCQVFVYESLQNNFSFDEDDITITTCRSSGAGGQHINTTDSAIKVVHNKTGLTSVSQDERSQFQNKQKALERLKEKVEKYYLEHLQKEVEKQKREQVKLIKNNFVAKTYDFENGKIIKANKQVILLKNFLQGSEL